MKRVAFAAILALIGAAFSYAETPPRQKLVVATASIFADMAEHIAGGHVQVRSVVPVGEDPHTYEPTPADARLVASADLILRNGLTFEGWLDDLIASANAEAPLVTITDGIEAIHAEQGHSSDPHAWMSALNGLTYIKNIKDALVQLDPDNRQVYEFNYGVYRKQLEDLDTYILEQIRKVPEKRRILVTSHDAFNYYGRRYGLRLESVLGISTEAEAQTSDLARLTRVIRESSLPAVFIESTVNPKLIAQLARDNKVRIGGSLFADSLGDKDSEAPTYYDMLKYNTDTIVRALAANGDEHATHPRHEPSNWASWAVLAAMLAGGFLYVWRKMII